MCIYTIYMYATGSSTTGVKRSSEDEKVSEKKARLAKFGLKFQSAGNLVTVGDRVRMEEGRKRGRGYRESVEKREREREMTTSASGLKSSDSDRDSHQRQVERELLGECEETRETAEEKTTGSKFSFNISKNKKAPPPNPDPSAVAGAEKKKGLGPCPPPLMSRRRELMTRAFGGDSDSEEDEGAEELTRMAVRGAPRFMFHIRK